MGKKSFTRSNHFGNVLCIICIIFLIFLNICITFFKDSSKTISVISCSPKRAICMRAHLSQVSEVSCSHGYSLNTDLRWSVATHSKRRIHQRHFSLNEKNKPLIKREENVFFGLCLTVIFLRMRPSAVFRGKKKLFSKTLSTEMKSMY